MGLYQKKKKSIYFYYATILNISVLFVHPDDKLSRRRLEEVLDILLHLRVGITHPRLGSLVQLTPAVIVRQDMDRGEGSEGEVDECGLLRPEQVLAAAVREQQRVRLLEELPGLADAGGGAFLVHHQHREQELLEDGEQRLQEVFLPLGNGVHM